MDAILLQGVTKSFGSQRAVDSVDLNVPQGSIFGLLGPNGSGKTTTIRMVLQIILPDSGQVRVLGSELDDALRRRIGYLPEERGLYRSMRVEDQLVFLGELHGLTPVDARRRGRRWLERLDAADWVGRKVQELSKGMQQKIQFIGTMLHEPDLVILDEPFSGLDPVNVRMMKDVMLELRERGATVVFSTHQMEQVERSCDRICLINEGRVVLEGALAQIRQKYGDETVQIEYDGKLPREPIADLVDSIDDHGRFAEIRLHRIEESGELLRRLVGAVEIRRFERSEASLNDIFIRLVGGGQ